MLRLIWIFFQRDFLLAVSYRTAFGLQLLRIVLSVPVIYFLSQVFVGSEAPSLKNFGGHYFPFLLLGIAFQDYLTLSLQTFTTSIREHQLMGTLEIVMLSPVPVHLILLFSSIWTYVFASLRFALYLIVAMVFGLDLSHASLLSLVLVLIFSVLSMASLGILTAGVTLLIKRGEGIVTILTLSTIFLGGVVYPIDVLPDPLQWLAQLLPFTHALSGVRKALMLGAAPSELLAEFFALAGFAIVLCPVALWAFVTAVRYAKKLGTLGQY